MVDENALRPIHGWVLVCVLNLVVVGPASLEKTWTYRQIDGRWIIFITLNDWFLQVGIHVQDGAKEFQTTSMHTQPLCDGQWHRITGTLALQAVCLNHCWCAHGNVQLRVSNLSIPVLQCSGKERAYMWLWTLNKQSWKFHTHQTLYNHQLCYMLEMFQVRQLMSCFACTSL